MISVGIVIGIYGDLDFWMPMAERAMRSVRGQTLEPERALISIRPTLAEARNDGIAQLDTEWIICLDADDELDSHYVEAMVNSEYGEIRRPITLGVYPDGTEDDAPAMIPYRDLKIANYIVIGAMFKKSLFDQVGGFKDLPMLDDWHLWRRMSAAGGRVVDVPDAIYRILVRPESRNKSSLHADVYRQIIAEAI